SAAREDRVSKARALRDLRAEGDLVPRRGHRPAGPGAPAARGAVRSRNRHGRRLLPPRGRGGRTRPPRDARIDRRRRSPRAQARRRVLLRQPPAPPVPQPGKGSGRSDLGEYSAQLLRIPMNTRERYAKHLLPVVAQGVEPLVVASAKGRTVVDEDGKSYLDCFSGMSVVNAGHNHPKILAAAREQMEKLVHCCSYVYHVPVVGRLAEQLATVAPGGLTKSFFSNSGAEAIEGAMRLAKQATGRREFVALGFSFHGRTIGTLSVTGNQVRKKGNGPYLPGVAFGPAPYCYRCPLGLKYPECDVACAHALKDVVRQQTSGDVAAFIAEPVLGEGGLVAPPPEYFTVAAQIFHENGALFIVDEVQTGFGRTGKMFGIDHSPDSAPDIVAMAKGIAGGFPLGAFMAKEPVSEAMKPGDHLSTFGGNPISCAA